MSNSNMPDTSQAYMVAINALQTRFRDLSGRSITAGMQTRQGALKRQQTGFYGPLNRPKCHVAVGVDGHAARKLP